MALGLIALMACARTDTGATADSDATCGWQPTSRITTEGIGELKVGQPADDVKRRCTVVSDTVVQDVEGRPQRVMRVRLGDAVVVAEIVTDTVWRITVTDSSLRTSDSLGVGTTLGTLLASNPIWVGRGETGVFVGLGHHCGLSFGMDMKYPGVPTPWVARKVGELQSVPPAIPVERVLILGQMRCRRTG